MARARSSGSTHSEMSWQVLLRALRHRNYRLFFGGQGISLVGTWMTRVATGWLVYRLTDSAFLLGLVSFAGQIPILLLGPFAGVWVDRWNRHRVLVVTQVLSMLQSFVLAALALTKVITVHEVIALNLFQGIINAFDMPARQAFVIEMVEDPDDLANAIALNSSLVNAARLVGPSVAGLLIAAVGEGWCFLIDGISYMLRCSVRLHLLGEAVSWGKRIYCAKGIPLLERGYDVGCSGVIGISRGIEKNVLSNEREHRVVAGEAGHGVVIHGNCRVCVGTTNSRDMTLLLKFVPFREVFGGSAGEAHQC